LKVVFYTSGVTGSGRIVRGISLALAFKRKGIEADFTILSCSPFAHLAERMGIQHIEIPPEDERKLSKTAWPSSTLYGTLSTLSPDVLVVDLLWFPLYNFIRELECRKLFLWEDIDPKFFSIALPTGKINFDPSMFDAVVAIEPFEGDGPSMSVHPLIIRNRDEILPREEAASRLGLDCEKKACLIAINAHPGDFERASAKYAHLESEGYQLFRTTNYKGGIFPAVDYFNAFDFVICGATYNSFWETRYFEKQAEYVPIRTQFLDGGELVRKWSDYTFCENGADELADLICSW
jgi:hypothetical protein